MRADGSASVSGPWPPVNRQCSISTNGHSFPVGCGHQCASRLFNLLQLKAASASKARLPRGKALTLCIAAPPQGIFVSAPGINEASVAVFEQGIAADLSAITQDFSPYLAFDSGPMAPVFLRDCAVVYLETDCWLLSKTKTWPYSTRSLSWPAIVWLRRSCEDTESRSPRCFLTLGLILASARETEAVRHPMPSFPACRSGPRPWHSRRRWSGWQRHVRVSRVARQSSGRFRSQRGGRSGR
jgi:hypothetical protein